MRTMTGLLILLGMLSLQACGLSTSVTSDAVSYHESADVIANRIILLNVLRAKDNAPLHFGELSLMHGQVSEQGGLTLTEPIGMVPKSTSLPRAAIAPSGSVGDQVAFDLGTLDTQTFTKGVTSPISPGMLKYFIENGVDHRLVLMLLLSGVRLPGGNELILNFPRSEREVCYPPNGPPTEGMLPTSYQLRAQGVSLAECPGRQLEFFAFLRVLNGLPRIYAVSHRTFTAIGKPFQPDVSRSLHDLMALDPAKHQVRRLPDGRLQFGIEDAEDKVVLCEEGSGVPTTPRVRRMPPAASTSDNVCGTENAQLLNAADGPTDASAVPNFSLRSTLGIFSFLGQVLALQDQESTIEGRDICVRLDKQAVGKIPPGCDTGQVLFHLTQDRAAARFGVEYQGRFWGVPNVPPCTRSNDHCDHTLETLSMVSLLLNLNKSARDIPSTPAVQLVP